MKKIHRHKKACSSLYHRWWFRFILIIVGMDMFILGFSFAIGFDIISYIPTTNLYFNLIVGFLYMLVASFVIHYAFDYHNFKRRTHLVCHHCGQSIEDGEKEC